MEIHFSMKIPGRLIKEGSFAEVLFLGGKIYCVIDIEVGIAIFQIKVQRIFIEADTIPDFVRYNEEFAVGLNQDVLNNIHIDKIVRFFIQLVKVVIEIVNLITYVFLNLILQGLFRIGLKRVDYIA